MSYLDDMLDQPPRRQRARLQHYGLKLVTAPTTLPVTMMEMREHLRILQPGTTDEDAILQRLAKAATAAAEQWVSGAFITQTWDLIMDEVPTAESFAIPTLPLQSVTSITSYDDADAASILDTANYRVAVFQQTPGIVTLKEGGAWPVDLRPSAAFVVRFVAGYGNATAVPFDIKQAILVMIASFYVYRESHIVLQGVTVKESPANVAKLLQPYRLLRL